MSSYGRGCRLCSSIEYARDLTLPLQQLQSEVLAAHKKEVIWNGSVMCISLDMLVCLTICHPHNRLCGSAQVDMSWKLQCY